MHSVLLFEIIVTEGVGYESLILSIKIFGNTFTLVLPFTSLLSVQPSPMT